MLERACYLKLVLNAICDMIAWNESGGPRLRRFRLSGTEWRILEEIHPLLDVSTSFAPA
jgi:hypothetical protein